MKGEDDKLIKMLMKTGQQLHMYASNEVIMEIISHPKMLHMADDGNDVFISIDDIIGFEIIENRVTKVDPNAQNQEASNAQGETSNPVAQEPAVG